MSRRGRAAGSARRRVPVVHRGFLFGIDHEIDLLAMKQQIPGDIPGVLADWLDDRALAFGASERGRSNQLNHSLIRNAAKGYGDLCRSAELFWGALSL
jgi:hypothetical protein